jgi:hypothetical protein
VTVKGIGVTAVTLFTRKRDETACGADIMDAEL